METIFEGLMLKETKEKTKLVEPKNEEVIRPLFQISANDINNIDNQMDQKTRKEKEKISRVKPEDLELIYMRDATVFNGINKIVQTIMGAGYTIKCSNSRVKEWYENFLGNVGNNGGELTWDEMIERIVKHQCIYGPAWTENVFNKKGNKIVDLDLIDPKKMDYAKNSSGDILLDQFGRPLGFMHKIPESAVGKVIGDPLPKDISIQSGYIFLKSERIAHFKLSTIGDGFYPTGLIEPSFNAALWKMNIEKGLANFIYMSGFPTRVAYCGDSNHEPTPSGVDSMLKILKETNYKQNIATEYFNKIQLLEPKNAEKMQEHLNYFNDQEITSMGIPRPFATGAGEETNRSTLQNQDRIFRLTLKDIINRTCLVIKKQIFARIAKCEGFKVIPEIVWNDIEETAEYERIEILIKGVQSGSLKPEEIKKELVRLMKYNEQ